MGPVSVRAMRSASERIAGIKDGVALGLEHIDRDREDFGLVIYDQDGFH